MRLIHISFGEPYCIVDENSNLVHDYKNAYEQNRVEKRGVKSFATNPLAKKQYKKLSYSGYERRDMDFKEWYEIHENSVPETAEPEPVPF